MTPAAPVSPGGAARAPARSLCHLLRSRAASFPDREILRFEGASMTLAALEARTNRLAGVLAGRGIRPGDAVGIMLPNGLDAPTAWLAVAKARAVVVPLNVTYREDDLSYVLENAGVRGVITDADHVGLVERVRRRCPELALVAVTGDATPSHRVVALDAEAAEAGDDLDIDGVRAGDVVTIQYTSGTTGFPKGCVLTHDYWLTLGAAAVGFSGLTAEDVALTAQPFSYMDPTWNLVACLMAGAPLVVLPRFSASTFWRSVRDNGVTFFYCLGTMPMYLAKQPEQPEVERGHRVRLVVCSGIPPAMHREFERRWGCPWREAYGTTELGCVLVVPADDVASVGSGAMGAPVAGREVKLAGPAGEAVPDGEAGELWVRGHAVMLGYHGNPEATAAWVRDGWARTGDLCHRDERGYYHLVGRLKDMIRRGGENVSAVEVEAVLCQHAGVQAAACVPVPDELRGEEVKAFVQLVPGETLDTVSPDALAAHARGRLAPFKVPRYYEYVDAFPLTASEKIAKAELLAGRADQRVGAYDLAAGAWG